MASEPKDYTIFYENKIQFSNFAYSVKGFQCHSNNSLQLRKFEGKNNKTIHVI